MSGRLKRCSTVIIEHDDLAMLLTELLCGWGLFNDLRVTFVSEDKGSFRLYLAPPPKPAK